MLCLFLPLLITPAHAQRVLLDPFTYPDQAAARSTWRAMAESPQVEYRTRDGGLHFPIPFRSGPDRFYWDRTVSLDLSNYSSFTLDVSCDQPSAMRSLAIYFKSRGGWYIWSKPLPAPGRQTLTMLKSDFSTEGEPRGWDRIEAIRISPWRGIPANTTLTLHSLHAEDTSVMIVQGTSSTPNAEERTVARRTAQRISQWLKDLHIPHGLITDDDLDAATLQRAGVLILAYNPNPTARQKIQLAQFLNRGGKLIVFYSGDPELASMMNMRLGNYTQAEGPGRWSAIAFDQPDQWMTPERIYQESWNIRPVYPTGAQARVVAHWENSAGEKKDPAVVVSGQGAWITHILLPSDDENKRYLMAGLIGTYDPSILPSIARQSMQRAVRIGKHASLAQAAAAIALEARTTPNAAAVDERIARARALHAEMESRFAEGRYAQVLTLSRQLRRTLLEAYAMAQRPVANEFRGAWDHTGVGLYPGDWDRTCRLLADSGINAIFPNLQWGGLAHYNSTVLPRSATVRLHGDQIELSSKAARKYGMELHVWIVCWNLTGAPPDFMERMKREGRLQVSASGETLPWLNPAHPANVALLIDSVKEIVTRYDIDGIHLDYIRYPNGNACFSDYTRSRFEEWLGRKVKHWPGDAQDGGPNANAFRQFRVDQINLVVRAVKKQIAATNPRVKLSAAVFGGYPDTIASIGQDWGDWLKKGEIDFVTPMNYTTDHTRFEVMTQKQLALPGARGNVLPGLGVTASESQLTPDQVIDQINTLRRLGANGFVLFDLNNTLREDTLPLLRMGLTGPARK